MVPSRADREGKGGPDSAFGPESVPLATGSVSVVYWVPGPFPRPNPYDPLSSRISALSVRLASPVLDCAATYP